MDRAAAEGRAGAPRELTTRAVKRRADKCVSIGLLTRQMNGGPGLRGEVKRSRVEKQLPRVSLEA